LTGAHVGLVFSACDTSVMNQHLTLISEGLAANAHAILVLDGAGWHQSKALTVPSNISLLFLPPYSPELNPIERLWLRLKERCLSHRLFQDLDEILSAGVEAWKSLSDEEVRSICRVSWLPNAKTPPA